MTPEISAGFKTSVDLDSKESVNVS